MGAEFFEDAVVEPFRLFSNLLIVGEMVVRSYLIKNSLLNFFENLLFSSFDFLFTLDSLLKHSISILNYLKLYIINVTRVICLLKANLLSLKEFDCLVGLLEFLFLFSRFEVEKCEGFASFFVDGVHRQIAERLLVLHMLSHELDEISLHVLLLNACHTINELFPRFNPLRAFLFYLLH